MTRTVCLVCCTALSVVPLLAGTGQTPVSQSTTVALTATIESIDTANRTVTLKKTDGSSLEIAAEPEMQGFNTLKVGDQVTATYYEAIVVSVSKPGTPAPPAEPVTAIQRKERKPTGRTEVLKVQEPKALQNIKAGDTVDVTYFESLLVNVSRPPK